MNTEASDKALGNVESKKEKRNNQRRTKNLSGIWLGESSRRYARRKKKRAKEGGLWG